MAKQIINVNAPNDLINVTPTANSSQGDPLRSAFIKINDALDRVDLNFTELYAFTGADAAANELVNGSQVVSLGADGTLTTPLLLPVTFTAVLDTAHMTRNVGLTDTPWQYEVQFQVNPDSSVQTMLDQIFPILINPGYISGDEFTFVEADHGIPDFTFTITLNDVVLPGGAGWTANVAVSQPPSYPATVKSPGAIKLTASTSSWAFGTDGTLTVPANATIKTAVNNLQITAENYLMLNSGNGLGQIEIGRYQAGGVVVLGGLNTPVIVDETYIAAAGYRLGNNIRNTTALPVNVLGGATTVIYTYDNWATSAKLVFQVEGQVDGDIANVRHTQTCEATIASTYNTNAEPAMSVYGIVHTSVTPLATFSIRRNGALIEVLATNSQATTDLEVKVQALQFVSRYD